MSDSIKPWTSGPTELLQHAIEHINSGSDFDKRIALISIDNAVELSIKTYLSLPKRIRKSKGPSRKKILEVENSFPNLLDLLEQYDDGGGFLCSNLEEIEWYHRLRNLLYHNGNGITIDSVKVQTYLEISLTLFQNLFGFEVKIDPLNRQKSLIGEFLSRWREFEIEFRTHLPPKDGPAYHWKRDFLRTIDPDLIPQFNALSEFRNFLVHTPEQPTNEAIKKHIQILNIFIEKMKEW